MAKKREETQQVPANRADKFTWDEGDLVFETEPKEEKEEEKKDLAWGQKPYSMSNPPSKIRDMPKHAQEIWVAAFNSAIQQYDGDEGRANATAYAAVKKGGYEQDEDGKWMAKKEVEPALAFSEKSGIPLVGLWDYGEADLTILDQTVTGRVQVAEYGLEGGEKGLRCYLHFDPSIQVDDGEPVTNIFAPLKNISEDGLKEALLQMGSFLEETARPFG